MTSDERADRPPAVEAAIARAADEAQVPVARVALLGYERVDWPDAGLGVRRPGMLHAQVVTPGYRVRLAVDGRAVTYHTDLTTRVVRAS